MIRRYKLVDAGGLRKLKAVVEAARAEVLARPDDCRMLAERIAELDLYLHVLADEHAAG